MLNTLKDLLDSLRPTAPEAGPTRTEHTLQLAAAVMLVEVMRADASIQDSERVALLAALRSKFALSDDEAQRLADLAETTARQSTDLYSFTSVINERFEMPAKLRMIEWMWRVALSDGQLSAHERHVMWRIGDLLHIPQGALHHARQRAQVAADSG